jgi:hypothetical protein
MIDALFFMDPENKRVALPVDIPSISGVLRSFPFIKPLRSI